MRFAFTNTTIIDGIDGKATGNSTIVIEDDKIIEIGSEVSNPGETTMIDASGCVVMPGLIDTHVHFGMPYTLMLPWHPGVRWGYINSSIIWGMKRMLSTGVTSARDMGGLDAGFVDAEEKGMITSPRLKGNVVQFLTPTNGSLDLIIPWGGRVNVRGETVGVPGLPDCHCDGPWESRKKVREMLLMGAETIKIGSGGCLVKRVYQQEAPTFSIEEIDAIVDESHKQGVKVHCHVEGGVGLRNAIHCGVDCIEHGWDMDDRSIDQMAEKGIWWVPTFWNCELVSRVSEGQKDRDFYSQGLEHTFKTLELAHKAGVRIAMGSDGGSYDEDNNASLKELEFMAQGGMSNGDIIVAATRLAAELLGVEDQVGTLEVGKKADLIVLEGDPLKDIRHLQDENRKKLVLKGGETVGGVWSKPQFEVMTCNDAV